MRCSRAQAFTRNNCDRKEADGLLERILEGTYGMPKTGVPGTSSGVSNSGIEGTEGDSVDSRTNAARALSTFSGAAFAADGVGREIAGLFTSDGIFFH